MRACLADPCTSRVDELIQAIASRILTQSEKRKMGVEAGGENEVQRGVWRSGKLLEWHAAQSDTRKLWETKLREDVAAARCPLPDTEPFKLTSA